MRKSFVHESATVESPSSIGLGTMVWRNVHVRAGSSVGSDCVIGENVYIDTGVVIGHRVKIQNQASIFGPAEIRDGAFIGPGATLTNDRVPRAVNPDGTSKGVSDWDARGAVVDQGASIGAAATLLGGTTIGAWAMVGAGAVVTVDVEPHTLVVGVPARPIGRVCKCGLRLDATLGCTCGRSYEAEKDGMLTELPATTGASR